MRYIIFIIIYVFTASNIVANTTTIEKGSFRYVIDTTAKTAAVYRCLLTASFGGKRNNVAIPSKIDYNKKTYTVTSIQSDCFTKENLIDSLSIPETISKIAFGAIDSDSNIKAIKFANWQAWYNTKKNGFYNHSYTLYINHEKIEHVTIPNDIINVGDFAYTDISSVYIPKNVKNILREAFYKCSSLSEVEIEAENIGNRAFMDCEKLATVRISPNVKVIGEPFYCEVFKNCTNLTSVYITDLNSWCQIKFESLAANPLCYAKNLYLNNKKIDDLNIPEGTLHIEEYSFAYGNFTHVTIPSTVESIGSRAFYYSTIERINIPDKITKIEDYTFQDCHYLSEIHLPSSLKQIGYGAFENCKKLENIQFPPVIETIGASAFKGCTSLKNIITIPNTVKYIRNSAFEGTNLSYVFSFAKLIERCETPFPGSCIVYTPEYYIDSYPYNKTKAICKETKTQTKISLSSGSEFTLEDAELKGFKPESSEGELTFKKLTPQKEYDIFIKGKAYGKDIEGMLAVITPSPELKINLKQATNTTLTIKGEYNGDMIVTKQGFIYNNDGEEVTLSGEDGEIILRGLRPNQNLPCKYYIILDNDSIFYTRDLFKTKAIELNVSSTPQSTSCTLKGSYKNIDATILESGFKESNSDELKETGLDPNTSYTRTYYVTTKEGGRISKTTTYKTKAIELETMQPKGVNTNCSIVSAKTNIDDDETNAGFQWRKYDAPSSLKSSEAYATVYNGMLEGYIQKLQPTSYYNVRAFYKSKTNKYYYGEWVTFDPSDFSFFEPTVHTYANINVENNTARVRGIALQGSDDIVEQGFEYWIEGENKSRSAEDIQTVLATGQSMEAELIDLAYNSTYNCRAFVKTAKSTTYGETQQFTTPKQEVSGINNIAYNGSECLNFAVKQEGCLKISISGNNETYQYRIANISGNQIAQGHATADNNWQNITEQRLPKGIYVISVTNNKQMKAKKIAIK